MFQSRGMHYVLLLAVAATMTFPALGTPSLWDIDESKNAEAAREMMESDNWVVPTFNYQPRFEKPALLYWLEIGAYHLFGINELAARFPSAIAALATVLTAYQLARRLFGAMTGLWTGVIVASAAGFCGAAHFANPDALLNSFTLLTFALFWEGFTRNNPSWFVLCAVTSGLAVLTKGPVGLVLPLAVTCLFLLWSRRFRILWDRRLLLAALAFILTSLPWYIWVAVDTKGRFLSSFILKDNVQRFLSPLEHHGGSVFYYLGVLAFGFAPWSVFLGLVAWFGLGRYARIDTSSADPEQAIPAAYRFLWCWIAVYLLFFSVASTKLPNYVLPVYPPLAILTGRFLERFRKGSIQPPVWTWVVSLGLLAGIGLATIFGLLVAGGTIELAVVGGRQLPGLEWWAALGALPILGAVSAGWCLRRQQRTGFVVALVCTAILFIASLASEVTSTVDAHKAPRTLVQMAHAQQTDHDIRVGCYQYFQPSLVFYCRREVHCLESEEQAVEFLRCPLPVCLFMPASVWHELRGKLSEPYALTARHSDLYRHYDVVVVSNCSEKR